MSERQKVLLVGWDAADWKVASPLMDQGKMPVLKSLVEQGVMGNSSTIHPVLSPMLWTSIATGKRPFKHGVYGFSEPLPDRSGVRPITNLQRKTKAIWNILGQSGFTSNVVGWWPSHPAEPIRGVMVSNHFHVSAGPLDKGWPVPAGGVHPIRLQKTLAELRLHPEEIMPEMVLPFIPRVAEIDQDKDRRLGSFMKIFADCTSVHAIATWLMENEPWDFMAVYFDAIDHFSHGFMRFHPPRLPHVPEKDFEIYRGVIEGAYRYHDMMLGRLVELAGPETRVILMSDHGFHPDHLRPRTIPREPAGPAVEHREHGILVVKGPGIRRDELVHGASLLDVTPTILTMFGLPTGEDMDGRVLSEIFSSPPPKSTVESWDDVSGESGMHPPGTELDPDQQEETLRHLEDLGYIERAGPSVELNVLKSQRELDYNLARSYMDAGLHALARPLLENLYRDFPEEYRFGIQLALCYRSLDHIAALRELVEAINHRREQDARIAAGELKKMLEIGEARKAARSGAAGFSALATEPEPTVFNAAELRRLHYLRSMSVINRFALDYLMGYVLTAEGRHQEALERLASAAKADPARPGLHVQIGEIFLKIGRDNEARAAFLKALSFDPNLASAHLGLCKCFLRSGKPFEAGGEAGLALGLQHFYPLAHYFMGMACLRLRNFEAAGEAFHTAIRQNPNFPEAHARLSALYRKVFHDPETATRHLRAAMELRRERRAKARVTVTAPLPPEAGGGKAAAIMKELNEEHERREAAFVYNGKPITVVTGLPRSGTSMLMQMLVAGGMEASSDGRRAPDADNPRGYFENELVRNLQKDSSWLKGEGGRVVKVVAQLLPFLRPGLDYRILFLRRDLDEVIASQSAMLQRLGRPGARLSAEQLKEAFTLQLANLDEMLKASGVPLLYVEHRELVVNTRLSASVIHCFLGTSLDVDRMASVVDPALYRQRAN